MKKTKSVIAMFLAFTMLFVSSCGTTTQGEQDVATNDASQQQKIVKINSSGGEPGTLEPGLSNGTHELWMLDQMFKGLYAKSPEGTIDFAIAESADVSEDGLTWTFKLRDFKWSTGNEGSANDFVEAFIFNLNPETAARYASSLWIIKNAEGYNSGQLTREEVGVKAIDDKTLEVTLETPVPYLPDLLTNTFFYPIDAKNALEHPDWYLTVDNYSTNGPFMLSKWTPKEEILLSKNENYYDVAKTKLDGLSFSVIEDKTTEWQMYEQGQLDFIYAVLPDVVDKLKAENNPELTLTSDLGTYYYHFNLDVKPFNNVKVRKALSMAINRNDITESVTKAGQIPAYTVTPPGVPDEKGEDFYLVVGKLYEENIDEAKKLLEEGLAEEGMTLADWQFKLIYNNEDVHKKVAQAIQSMWATNLGVNCTLENTEFQVLLERRSLGDYDVARAGWLGDYVDPMTFLEIFKSDAEFNDGNWKNTEYDKLVEASLYNQDPAGRMQQLKDAETILINDMGIMPIYYYSKSIVQKPYLTGVYTPVNKYPYLEYADIVTQQ